MPDKPRMTVGDLKAMLARWEDDRELRICPKKSCNAGFPEWRNANVILDIDGAIVILEPTEEH